MAARRFTPACGHTTSITAPRLKARAIDVKVAPGLRVGYVMGTGDTVPEAMEGLGIRPHLLTTAELFSSDLSAWDTIVIGIRAYSVRPELGMIQARPRRLRAGWRNPHRPVSEQHFPRPGCSGS